MNRRTFLRFLLATPLALSVDVEKLIWIPNQSIVVPSNDLFFKEAKVVSTPFISESQIVAIELERIYPHLKDLFERDSIFYKALET